MATIAAAAIIYVCTYFFLRSSTRIKRLIGRTGDDILRRVLGVILAALSVQFITDGIRQIIAGG